jgi:hypothetical protein
MPRHFGLHPPDVGQNSNWQRFVNLLHFVPHDLRIPFPQRLNILHDLQTDSSLRVNLYREDMIVSVVIM